LLTTRFIKYIELSGVSISTWRYWQISSLKSWGCFSNQPSAWDLCQ